VATEQFFNLFLIMKCGVMGKYSKSNSKEKENHTIIVWEK